MKRILLLVFAAALWACAPLSHHSRPTLLFLSDFGVRDGAVGACKGVMLDIEPRLRIIDLSHEIPPYDIATAAEALEQAVPFYPPGTVVVAVVDPGVGSARKSMAARTKAGHLLVGPDNGIFSRLIDKEGFDKAVELSSVQYFREPKTSSTFHGRDIFSPVGAHLAHGTPIEELGPPITPRPLTAPAAKREGDTVVGEVRYIEDPYGNVVTNIPPALLEELSLHVGDTMQVEIAGKPYSLPFRKTFSDVPVGKSLAVMHSRNVLSFSINQGDFAAKFGVKRGDSVSARKP